MATTRTKVQQQTIVGEALAVGVIALGVEAVIGDVQWSFRRAWRRWAPSTLFPEVHASAQRDDITRILDKSERRQGSIVAYWARDREYVPVLRHDWSIEDTGEHLAEMSGVSFEQWIDLARAFVEELGAEGVRRAE